jgi:hypothetical protein
MRSPFLKIIVASGLVLAGTNASPAASETPVRASRPPNHETHWAFVAPARPAIPAVKNARWVRNPVDHFVLARLEKEHLAPSPEADRRTLIRRLYLDLLGLPPTPEQVRAFLSDKAPDAYERLVDALLDSPHFGERWGRHWLDLARYADSSGYQVDRPRPFAWVYRDWVINAFNDDLPFDQFTVEQLAGDLLPGASLEQKAAAGFHRLTLMNHEDGVDQEEFRCKARVDRVSVTGTAWLGLTLGCAECHNHKYDPISQREFYQVYAFFNNAQEVDVPMAPPTNQVVRTNSSADARWPAARHRRIEPQGTNASLESFAENVTPARAAIHVRGDFLRKGEEVNAGTPAVLPRLKSRQAHPDRLDLARWMIDPTNPLTARVAVNHVWQHLFGRGLVNTPEDFGLRGERPSHPQLLDWLAVAFASPCRANAERGTRNAELSHIGGTSSVAGLAWSRKALIKLIVTSATYRQASSFRPDLAERDPQNVLLARQNRLRVESEIMRDLSLAISGLLKDDIGGPSFHPHLPDDVKKLGLAGAFSWADSEGPEKYRRGLYIFAQRTVPYPTSMTLDQADPTQTCPRRERSNTPLQALTLLNHGLFVECAQALGKRLLQIPARTSHERLEQAVELCLSRKPTKAELDRIERLFLDQLALARTNPAASVLLTGLDPAQPRLAETASLIALSQVLLNLDEFMTRE